MFPINKNQIPLDLSKFKEPGKGEYFQSVDVAEMEILDAEAKKKDSDLIRVGIYGKRGETKYYFKKDKSK